MFWLRSDSLIRDVWLMIFIKMVSKQSGCLIQGLNVKKVILSMRLVQKKIFGFRLQMGSLSLVHIYLAPWSFLELLYLCFVSHFIVFLHVTFFLGEVWPGPCVFPDFTQSKARSWWANLVRDFTANGVDGIWNDMNEPAIFKVKFVTSLHIFSSVPCLIIFHCRL